MSVCTFVEGPAGKRWFQLLADVDSPGVYALVMNQGTYHGNGCPKEDESHRLPVCLGLASYTDRDLRSFAACQFRDSAGMVARVACQYVRTHLCNLWREDLQNIGGLPKGLPNSEKLGIQRSSGLGFGQASVAVRRCEGVRRLWDAAAVVVGRPPVFGGDYAHAPCCTSFDGVLVRPGRQLHEQRETVTPETARALTSALHQILADRNASDAAPWCTRTCRLDPGAESRRYHRTGGGRLRWPRGLVDPPGLIPKA